MRVKYTECEQRSMECKNYRHAYQNCFQKQHLGARTFRDEIIWNYTVKSCTKNLVFFASLTVSSESFNIEQEKVICAP